MCYVILSKRYLLGRSQQILLFMTLILLIRIWGWLDLSGCTYKETFTIVRNEIKFPCLANDIFITRNDKFRSQYVY